MTISVVNRNVINLNHENSTPAFSSAFTAVLKTKFCKGFMIHFQKQFLMHHHVQNNQLLTGAPVLFAYVNGSPRFRWVRGKNSL